MKSNQLVVRSEQDEATRYWSSLPLVTREERLSLLSILSMREHDADKFKVDGGIPIVNMIRTKYEYQSEDGNVSSIDRYIVQDTKGNWYNLFGVGIVKDIDNLVICLGRPPYNPPVIFRLLEVDVGKPSKLKRMTFE